MIPQSIPLLEYNIISTIASGSHGCVYLAQKDGRQVAIKTIFKPYSSRDAPIMRKRAEREVRILSTLNHPNILKLLEFQEEEDIFLVLEYLPSNLAEVISAGISFDKAQMYSEMLLLGLSYLEDMHVLHRDIKPSNILISADSLKIADFGLCRYHDTEMSHQVSTRWYRAPELLFGARKYDYKVDMWSAGCIMAEMVTLEPLFKGSSDIDQICVVFDLLGTPNEEIWPEFSALPDYGKLLFKPEKGKSWDELIPSCNSDLLDLISKILVFSAKKRLSAKEALQHAFMTKLNR